MANNFNFLGREILSMIKKKEYGQLALALCVLLIIVLAQQLLVETGQPAGGASADLLSSGRMTIHRVLDGDTFAYMGADGERIVRLLGVNSPETKDPRKPVECFGREAAEFLKQMLQGQNVRLEKDPKARNIDKYGRELRYAYLDDGRMVNKLLLEYGYAQATPEYPFTLSEEFVMLEDEAKNSGRGLWNEDACRQ